jgi:hypothetical protein
MLDTWHGSSGKAATTASCLATEANMQLIDEYGIAFFERHLKHKSTRILTRNNSELADYQFKLPVDFHDDDAQ